MLERTRARHERARKSACYAETMNQATSIELCDRSDEELLSGVTKLTGSHRELTALIVAHLAEIEERRLHLLAGFSSMFDFCQRKLGFSEGEAFRRILAARLARRFPVVISLLASGRLNLSALELLREHLTEENHAELFAAVSWKRKLDLQMILAARFPRPDRPSRIRREANIEPLSEARFKIEFTASDVLRKKLELCRDLMSHANPSRDLALIIERGVDLLLERLERTRLGKTKKPRRVDGIRAGKASVGVGAQEGNPSDDASTHEGKRPRIATAVCREGYEREEKRSRIATAVRRKVYERDGVRCTYVSEDGRRCAARAFLELDHTEAKALGGSNDTTNLRVLCRAHNQLSAEQTFGREWMERSRHLRWQKSTGREQMQLGRNLCQQKSTGLERMQPGPNVHQRWSTPAIGDCAAVSETDVRVAQREAGTTIFEKVRSALRNLGFRDAETRRAIAKVIEMSDPSRPPTLEQALREALVVATAA
jgi:5-methylcytosine-specific restriction endonuclease McrA